MDLRNRPRRSSQKQHSSHQQHPSNPGVDAFRANRPTGLPPSVARVADRTRLSAELLAAILEVADRTRVSLDDIELADALADRLLARRRDRLRLAASA
ncbi:MULTISPECIES: hypothetical protein [unclassified Frankia]|uniref:hypothetical protein n=1 Tax=unclassified Frankia TaxID=2632575 RepID=UPI002AD58AF5|nr:MULTISPECIES: hypothetical protein [unclassified Frankia]